MITEKDIIEYLKVNDTKALTVLRGHVNIVDKFGNIILDKDNLVVFKGREFILNKLFSGINNVPEENRVIMAYGVGDGGTGTETTGTNVSPSPFLPSYTDTKLMSQRGGLVKIEPAYITKKVDINNNEVYMHLVIKLDEIFTNNSVINEFGLFAVDEGTTNNPQLVTRITFGDIMYSAGDELTLNYYLYA